MVIVKDQSSHLVYLDKTTNLWKFELNWSSELRDNNDRKNNPCHTKMCAFRCLISRPQNLILSSRNEIRVDWLLSRKLRYFRGSRSHNVVLLPTALIIIIISKSYIAHVSTKQGTQGAEYIQTFRKIGYCIACIPSKLLC